MNVTQINLTHALNNTEVWFGFGSNLTNESSMGGNGNARGTDGPSEEIKVFSYILASIIGLCLLVLVCCVCWICCLECMDNCKKTSRGVRTYNRDNDLDYYDSNEDDETYTTSIQVQTFTFEKGKKKTQQKITETPLDQIFLPVGQNVDELTCTICLEKIDLSDKGQTKVIQLDCRHIYHQDCISSWYFGGITSVQSCPLCRVKIDHVVIQVDPI